MRLLVGLAVTAAGCGMTGESLLICHNANCAPGATSAGDDTLESLRASLALRMADGSMPYDGIELDSVWDRARGRCIFAHEPDAGAPDFADAIELVVDHVAGALPSYAAHAGFHLKIELKADVGGGDSHTAAEVAAHVSCVTRAARAVVAAGVTSQNLVVRIFDSDDPYLLAAIDVGACEARPGTRCLFETGWDAPLPPGFTPQLLTLNWYDYRRSQQLDLQHRTHSAGAWGRGELAIWARSPSPQDLYAMLVLHPAYLTVNNVQEARALLDAR